MVYVYFKNNNEIGYCLWSLFERRKLTIYVISYIIISNFFHTYIHLKNNCLLLSEILSKQIDILK